MHCGTTSPASEYCPKCGKRRGKWCPKCQTWKAAEFHSLDVNYDLQAVLADLDRIFSRQALGRHRLLVRQQPDFDIQMRQLAGRDRREAMVFVGSPLRGMDKGRRCRHRLTEKPAAAAQPSTALQAHKRPEHWQTGCPRQLVAVQLQVAALRRGSQHARRAFQDCLLLRGREREGL